MPPRDANKVTTYTLQRERILRTNAAYVRRNYVEVRAKQNKAKRELRVRVRHAAIKMYGGKCACCKEPDYRFLTIDHIAGGGKAHRASFLHDMTYYRWLVELRYRRKGFKVLCFNCNFAEANGGCPHRRNRAT